MKKQAYDLIDSMDDKMLSSVVELLKNFKVNNGIQILWGNSNDIYASLPTTLLKIMEYDDNIGPETKYILNNTPFNIPLTKIVDDYVIDNAEKFIAVPEGYVLKKNNEVLLNGGGKVVFEGYVFYSRYNGSVSYLYVSENDLKLSIEEDDVEYSDRTIKRYVVATSQLQKFVHTDNLENEFKLYKEMHEFWAESANWTSSGEE
jgi:hypothetical protein